MISPSGAISLGFTQKNEDFVLLYSQREMMGDELILISDISVSQFKFTMSKKKTKKENILYSVNDQSLGKL